MRNLILLSLIFITSCGGEVPLFPTEWRTEAEGQLSGLGISKADSNFKYYYTTPGGVKIESTVPVPADNFAPIDSGIHDQIQSFKVMFPEWVSTPQQTIFFVDPNRTYELDGTSSPPCQNEVTEPGSPCIYVKGVRAAGTVIGLNDTLEELRLNPAIVLPHQAAQNWQYKDYLRRSVHYEREHRVAYDNRTVNPTGVFYHFTGANDSHPFQWGNAKSLVSPTKHNCGL